jgi:hypothetical protein
VGVALPFALVLAGIALGGIVWRDGIVMVAGTAFAIWIKRRQPGTQASA